MTCSQRRFREPEFDGSDLNFAGWAKKVTGVPTTEGLADPSTGPADPAAEDEAEDEADGGADDPAAVGGSPGSPRSANAAMPAVAMRTRATAAPTRTGRDTRGRARGGRCRGGAGGRGIDAL